MLSRLQPSKKVALPLAGAISLGALGALLAYKFGLYGSTKAPEASPKTCLKGLVSHIEKNEKNPLTKEEMLRRKQQILDINYYLVLNLLQGEYYEGYVNITFNLKHAVTSQLFLDFVYGEGVYSVEVNGKDITSRPDVYRKQRIALPEELLQMGENKVVVNFLKKYAKDGAGLHSVDDAEGFQYIYSQCESTYCCRIFPCFDQPNLKATLEFHSITPKEWTVVSNEPIARLDICHKSIYDKYRLRNQRNEEEETIFAIFNITQRISTYLYAFIAGPYDRVSLPAPEIVPMTIYGRKAVYQDFVAQSKDIFEDCNAAIEFYEKFFQTRFPFSKLDTIFILEFNYGAMENVGAVIYSEEYCLIKGEADIIKRTEINETFLHEIAHMWFGNLVTMDWWDGLFLNESFATIMSKVCQTTHPLMKKKNSNVWLYFMYEKLRGIEADERPTTHPVQMDVENTEVAENIFDGITYIKGASILKQIFYLMGYDNFSNALATYFRKFRWENTSYRDFFDTLQTHLPAETPFTFEEFNKQWLLTTGVNTLSVEFDEGEIDSIRVLQSSDSESQPLRVRKTKVALFYEPTNPPRVFDIFIEAAAVSTVKLPEKVPAPQGVLINYDDEDYCKVIIDPKSAKYFADNLYSLSDPMVRGTIYKAQYESMRDAKMCPLSFIDTMVQSLKAETEKVSLSYIRIHLLKVLRLLPPEIRCEKSHLVFSAIYEELLASKDAGEHNDLIEMLSIIVEQEEDCQLLVDICNNVKPEISVHVTKKWEILNEAAILRLDSKGFQDLEKSLLDLGKSVEATNYNLLKKGLTDGKAVYEEIHDQNTTLSHHSLAYYMRALNNRKNKDQYKEMAEQFFERVKEIFSKRSMDFSKVYWMYLIPSRNFGFVELKERLEKLLATLAPSDKTLSKLATERIFELNRSIKIQETFLKK